MLKTPRQMAFCEILLSAACLAFTQRLMKVVSNRLGHHLATLAEQTKIDVAVNGHSLIDLDVVEDHLQATFSDVQQADALEHKVSRIVDTARDTVRRANVHADKVSAVYFTGGSTGLHFLTERIATLFPQAKRVAGDRFSSVANGLGIYAIRKFGEIQSRA